MGASSAMSSAVKSPSCHVCWRGGHAVVQGDKVVYSWTGKIVWNAMIDFTSSVLGLM